MNAGPLGHPGLACGGGDPPERRLPGVAAHGTVGRAWLADPVLPAELLRPEWPGTALRDAYARYQREQSGQVRAHGARTWRVTCR
ncbi:hypothetical protein SVIOM342S_10022 [Streptomyces violaceorubidus]